MCRCNILAHIITVDPGGDGTPLYDLNEDVRPDRVWFSGCFVLNGRRIKISQPKLPEVSPEIAYL